MKECVTAMTEWLSNRIRMISAFRILFIAAVFVSTVPLNGQPADEIATEIWNFTMSFDRAHIAQVVWNASEGQNEYDFSENFEQFLPEGTQIDFVDPEQGIDGTMHQVRVVFQYKGRNWVYECSAVQNSPATPVSLKSIVLYRMNFYASKVVEAARWESE